MKNLYSDNKYMTLRSLNGSENSKINYERNGYERHEYEIFG